MTEVATENPFAMQSCLSGYFRDALDLEGKRKTLAERILVTANEKIAPQISPILKEHNYSIHTPETRVIGLDSSGRPAQGLVPIAFDVRFWLNYQGKPINMDRMPDNMDKLQLAAYPLCKKLAEDYGLRRIGFTFGEVQIG